MGSRNYVGLGGLVGTFVATKYASNVHVVFGIIVYLTLIVITFYAFIYASFMDAATEMKTWEVPEVNAEFSDIDAPPLKDPGLPAPLPVPPGVTSGFRGFR